MFLVRGELVRKPVDTGGTRGYDPGFRSFRSLENVESPCRNHINPQLGVFRALLDFHRSLMENVINSVHQAFKQFLIADITQVELSSRRDILPVSPGEVVQDENFRPCLDELISDMTPDQSCSSGDQAP